MADFNDPAVNTYAGMMRLVEGIHLARETLRPDLDTKTYLSATISHHNTGHFNAINDANWKSSYGDEVFKMMAG